MFFYLSKTTGGSANNYCGVRTIFRSSSRFNSVHRAKMERWMKWTVYKGHSVQEQTTNTASWNCPRLTISRTAVKRWQSLPNQRFIVEFGQSQSSRLEMLVKLRFPYGVFKRVRCSLNYKRDRESMNCLFWFGYCPEPEHSVEEHCVSSLLSQEPIVSLDRYLTAEWKIFVETNIVIF